MSPAQPASQILSETVLAPAASRRPTSPTLFLPGFADPRVFAELADLAIWLREAAGQAPLSFNAGAACYDGFDTFPSVTAYAGGNYLATVAVPGLDAGAGRARLAALCGFGLEDAA